MSILIGRMFLANFHDILHGTVGEFLVLFDFDLLVRFLEEKWTWQPKGLGLKPKPKSWPSTE